jgi:hypothetical protein
MAKVNPIGIKKTKKYKAKKAKEDLRFKLSKVTKEGD